MLRIFGACIYGLFLLSLGGQAFAGWKAECKDSGSHLDFRSRSFEFAFDSRGKAVGALKMAEASDQLKVEAAEDAIDPNYLNFTFKGKIILETSHRYSGKIRLNVANPKSSELVYLNDAYVAPGIRITIETIRPAPLTCSISHD